ncbi:MAG: ABC transporter substrate-binding protein [Nitrospirota bacterium]
MQKAGPYIILPLLFITLIYAILSSCNRTDETPYGDTLYIAEYQNPSIINPILTISTISIDLAEIIFDGLIKFNEKLEAKPHLASSWEVADGGLILRFNLRRGVFFHDGIEMTAGDVKFTIDNIEDPRYKRRFFYAFQDVKEVITRDRYTIDIILARPNSSFINNLFVGILPRHLLEKEDLLKTDFNYHPIGTGPFRFKSWSDKEIALEANKNYFLGRPYLDRIIAKIYPNQEAAWSGLMIGGADYFSYLTPDNFNILKKIPEFNAYSTLMPLYYTIAFNLKDKIFKDKRVRQALNHAIDKERIVKDVLKEEGMISNGPIYPGSWVYAKEIPSYPYDPKRAIKLLKESGWMDHNGDHILDKGGYDLEFTLYINEGDNLKDKSAIMIQDQLLDIGIRMRVKKVTAASLLDFLSQKRFDAIFQEILAAPDPDINYTFWHSSQIKDGVNWFSYRNEDIDRLLDQGRATLDEEERKKVYGRFQKEIVNDPPGIFLFWSNYLVGVHKRFKGVKITAAGPFSNIREWYVPKSEQRHR